MVNYVLPQQNISESKIELIFYIKFECITFGNTYFPQPIEFSKHYTIKDSKPLNFLLIKLIIKVDNFFM